MAANNEISKVIEEIIKKAETVASKQEELNKIVPALELANTTITEASAALKENSARVGVALGDTANAMAPALTQLEEVLKDYNPAKLEADIAEVNTQLLSYHKMFEDILDKANQVNDRQQELTSIRTALDNAVKSANQASENLISLVGKYDQSLQTLSEAGKHISSAASQLKKTEPSKLSHELTEINSQLSEMKSLLENSIESAGKRDVELQKILEQGFGRISELLNEIMSSKSGSIVDQVGQLATKFKPTAGKFFARTQEGWDQRRAKKAKKARKAIDKSIKKKK